MLSQAKLRLIQLELHNNLVVSELATYQGTMEYLAAGYLALYRIHI